MMVKLGKWLRNWERNKASKAIIEWRRRRRNASTLTTSCPQLSTLTTASPVYACRRKTWRWSFLCLSLLSALSGVATHLPLAIATSVSPSLSLTISSFWSAVTFSLLDALTRGWHPIRRVLVSCSAGNSGPDLLTAVNVAPWILTDGVPTATVKVEPSLRRRRSLPAVIRANGPSINASIIWSDSQRRSPLSVSPPPRRCRCRTCL